MPKSRSNTVLVVEDDVNVRTMICRVLQKARYTALEASNGTEAMHFFDQMQDSIGLVITDIVMPGISGFDLIKRLRSLRPLVKSIYMSGYSNHPMFGKDELELHQSFLLKPFTTKALLKMVSETLGPTDLKLLHAL